MGKKSKQRREPHPSPAVDGYGMDETGADYAAPDQEGSADA